MISSLLLFFLSLPTEAYQVPLTSQGEWKVVNTGAMPAHEIGYGDFGLRMSVKNSQSSVRMTLPKNLQIKGFKGEARLKGALPMKRAFLLKVGFLESKSKEPVFYKISNTDKNLKNEKVIGVQKTEGDFSFEANFERPIGASEIWLSADSESADSDYSIQVNLLELVE